MRIGSYASLGMGAVGLLFAVGILFMASPVGADVGFANCAKVFPGGTVDNRPKYSGDLLHKFVGPVDFGGGKVITPICKTGGADPKTNLTGPYFASAYNAERQGPDWVAFFDDQTRMSKGGTYSRKGKTFKCDPEAAPGCKTDDAYYKYDRGHMGEAEAMTWSEEALTNSFLFSNALPQTGSFNRGIWAQLERCTRIWADSTATGSTADRCRDSLPEAAQGLTSPSIHIVAGPIPAPYPFDGVSFKGMTEEKRKALDPKTSYVMNDKGSYKECDKDRYCIVGKAGMGTAETSTGGEPQADIPVPPGFFKIIYFYEGSGATNEFKDMAVYMFPHGIVGASGTKIGFADLEVDDAGLTKLEALTGLTFFMGK